MAMVDTTLAAPSQPSEQANENSPRSQSLEDGTAGPDDLEVRFGSRPRVRRSRFVEERNKFTRLTLVQLTMVGCVDDPSRSARGRTRGPAAGFGRSPKTYANLIGSESHRALSRF